MGFVFVLGTLQSIHLVFAARIGGQALFPDKERPASDDGLASLPLAVDERSEGGDVKLSFQSVHHRLEEQAPLLNETSLLSKLEVGVAALESTASTHLHSSGMTDHLWKLGVVAAVFFVGTLSLCLCFRRDRFIRPTLLTSVSRVVYSDAFSMVNDINDNRSSARPSDRGT